VESGNFTLTRIAPTPSGYLHLGNIYSFLISAELAKRSGAKIFLRIDDLDQDRFRKEYVEDIFASLRFLSIEWDTGPRNFEQYEKEFSQFRRLQLYDDMLDELVSRRLVFACTCTRSTFTNGEYPGTCSDKNLPLDTPEACWRLRTDPASRLLVKGIDGKYHEAGFPSVMNYFVVRKKDRLPAYQLASLVDDHHFKTDLIIRGSDLFASTLAQLFLAGKLGMSNFLGCAFCHHTLIADSGGRKLSKSEGDLSVRHHRESGKRPEDIYETLGALLGFQKFSPEALIKQLPDF
jgi:glutamyl/glutaminyl-tRNA synthetase